MKSAPLSISIFKPIEPTPNKSWIPITVAIVIVAAIALFFIMKKPAQAPMAVTPDPVTGEQSGTSVLHETTNPNPPVDNPPPPTPITASYTKTQVALHNNATSCWAIVSGMVYDVTSWIGQHPGGSSAILSLCGHDGTASFQVQHGGQARPESELASFKIGVLVQ